MAKRRKIKRKSRRNSSNGITLLLGGILLLSAAWLLFAIIKGISPIEVFKGSQTEKKDEPISYDSLNTLYNTALIDNQKLESQLNAYKQTPNYRKVFIENGTLNLRQAPNTTADIVRGIPSGELVKLRYCNIDSLTLEGGRGTWCKINYKFDDGWVWSAYLEQLEL